MGLRLRQVAMRARQIKHAKNPNNTTSFTRNNRREKFSLHSIRFVSIVLHLVSGQRYIRCCLASGLGDFDSRNTARECDDGRGI